MQLKAGAQMHEKPRRVRDGEHEDNAQDYPFRETQFQIINVVDNQRQHEYRGDK